MSLSSLYLSPYYYFPFPRFVDTLRLDHPGQKNRNLGKDGLSLFHKAILEGDKEKIEKMTELDKGYRKTFKTVYPSHYGEPTPIPFLKCYTKGTMFTPLYLAITKKKNSVNMLLEATYKAYPNLSKNYINKLFVNTPCKESFFMLEYPLQTAVKSKSPDLVSKFIDLGADMDKGYFGQTTYISSSKELHVRSNILVTAAMKSNPETLKALINHPSQSKTWENLDDAMSAAVVKGRFKNAATLLALGANPNHQFKYLDHDNPRRLNRTRVASLVEYIANPKNDIPLNTRETFIKMLIDKGAKAKSSKVLYYAATLSSEKLAKLFLDNGAKIWSRKSIFHPTPYKFAKNEYLKDKNNKSLLNIVKLYHEKQLEASNSKSNPCGCFGPVFNKEHKRDLAMN